MTADLERSLQSALSDRYRLVREIGRGGMGIVFLADDLRHSRQVAIKVMRPDLIGSVNAERFLREIQTSASLTHPGIVPVHDSGRADDALYFVMPYVDGPSLRELIKREGQFTVERAMQITSDIADALSFAHARGIVHRDIKPANIVLDADRPLIVDFGLALATQSSDARLSRSLAVGTPEYMSPEQAAPEGQVDGRTDQYALACVLYEMLAGEPPVTGATAGAIIARKSVGEIRSLRVVRPAVPRPMAAAITRALRPVPADRFARIEDFIAALRRPDRGWWTARRAASVASLTAAAIVGLGAFLSQRAPSIDPHLVVVSPFENHTNDARYDAIGTIVADWVADGLLDSRLLRVVPTPTAQRASQRANAAAISDNRDPLARLAAETGAGVIVWGEYYLTGGRLMFRAQISEVASPSWWRPWIATTATLRKSTDPIAGHVDSVSTALAAVRSRVVGLVAVEFEPELTRRELGQQPPTYEAYLRFSHGMSLYVAEDTLAAASAFLEAYALDTTFTTALFYAAVNFSNARRYATEDSLLRIVARSESRLSNYQRRWLEFRRALLDGDRPHALRAIRVLAAEEPGSKAVYNLGIEAWENGYLAEAAQALESLDPEAGPMLGFQHYWGALANIYHLMGNYRAALKAAQRARAADPAGWRAVGWELAALTALGRTKEVMTRASALAHASADDNNWSPAEALREAAEEMRAHGHAELADSLWRMALAWYRAPARGPMIARERFGMAHTLYALGQFSEAEAVARALYADAPADLAALGLIGTAAARRGNIKQANEIMHTLEQVDPRYQAGRPTFQRALISAALGQREVAVSLLRDARRQGRSYQLWVHRELDFESVRETPEYKSLLRPIAFSVSGRP